MEKQVIGVKAVVLMVLLVASGNCAVGNAQFTCSDPVTALLSCQSYLVDPSVPQPNPACCQGIATVSRKATTKEIRQQLCNCFKEAAKKFGVIPGKAKSLPDQCHVSVPVPIDPNVDCSTISV